MILSQLNLQLGYNSAHLLPEESVLDSEELFSALSVHSPSHNPAQPFEPRPGLQRTNSNASMPPDEVFWMGNTSHRNSLDYTSDMSRRSSDASIFTPYLNGSRRSSVSSNISGTASRHSSVGNTMLSPEQLANLRAMHEHKLATDNLLPTSLHQSSTQPFTRHDSSQPLVLPPLTPDSSIMAPMPAHLQQWDGQRVSKSAFTVCCTDE